MYIYIYIYLIYNPSSRSWALWWRRSPMGGPLPNAGAQFIFRKAFYRQNRKWVPRRDPLDGILAPCVYWDLKNLVSQLKMIQYLLFWALFELGVGYIQVWAGIHTSMSSKQPTCMSRDNMQVSRSYYIEGKDVRSSENGCGRNFNWTSYIQLVISITSK